MVIGKTMYGIDDMAHESNGNGKVSGMNSNGCDLVSNFKIVYFISSLKNKL